MTRKRRGIALAVTIGVVSLISILAVATLSLAGRLAQTSTLGLRDARLDAGAAFGLSSAIDDWRAGHFGRLAVGATASFETKPAGMPTAVVVSVTRIAPEIFWIVAEGGEGGAVRRENLVVRSRVPDAASLAGDSTNVTTLGFISIDSIAATADWKLTGGSTFEPLGGVVHVAGDATLLGGTGGGVLIVEGRLVIAGALSYEGVIVARGGISVIVPGVTITGVIRSAVSPPVIGNMAFNMNGSVAQNVLLQTLTPRQLAARRWAELP